MTKQRPKKKKKPKWKKILIFRYQVYYKWDTQNVKIPKTVYKLLYIGGNVTICLIRVTGFIGNVRWLSRRVRTRGPLVTGRMTATSNGKNLAVCQSKYRQVWPKKLNPYTSILRRYRKTPNYQVNKNNDSL